MSFGGFERGSAPSQPMAEINVTPLVDVMLVLLVVFIITAPLLTHAIRLDLPAEPAPAAAARGPTIGIAIDADGAIFWDAGRIEPAALRERLARVARQAPQPELHLRADRQARYERVALVMAAAQQAGLTKIGFVTEPERLP
jgi:biopolymer transport protein ExbD